MRLFKLALVSFDSGSLGGARAPAFGQARDRFLAISTIDDR